MNFTHDSPASLEGVLWSYRGGWITLKDVVAVARQQQEPAHMIGEVVLHRAQVAYMQVLP